MGLDDCRALWSTVASATNAVNGLPKFKSIISCGQGSQPFSFASLLYPAITCNLDQVGIPWHSFILPCELNDFIAPWMVAGSLSMSCGPAAVVHNGLERRICPCHKFSWQRLQLLTSSRRTQLLADVCGVNTVSWWPTYKTTHGTIGASKKRQLSVSLLVLFFPLFYACRRCYYHWGKAKHSSTARKW